MLDWIAPSTITAALLVIATLAVKKMVAEELTTRIGGLPRAAFWLALRFVPKDDRADQADEWSSDLEILTTDTDGKPLTRIWKSLRFCTSLVRTSAAIQSARRTTAANREREGERFVYVTTACSLILAPTLGVYPEALFPGATDLTLLGNIFAWGLAAVFGAGSITGIITLVRVNRNKRKHREAN